MWHKVVLIVVLVLFVILGLWVYSERQTARLEAMSIRLETTQKDLLAAQAAIEQLNEIIARQEAASDILITRIDEGAKSYVEKVHDIDSDDDACDWLDALLPDSVRKYYGGSTDDPEDHPPVDSVTKMPPARARVDGN